MQISLHVLLLSQKSFWCKTLFHSLAFNSGSHMQLEFCNPQLKPIFQHTMKARLHMTQILHRFCFFACFTVFSGREKKYFILIFGDKKATTRTQKKIMCQLDFDFMACVNESFDRLKMPQKHLGKYGGEIAFSLCGRKGNLLSPHK